MEKTAAQEALARFRMEKVAEGVQTAQKLPMDGINTAARNAQAGIHDQLYGPRHENTYYSDTLRGQGMRMAQKAHDVANNIGEEAAYASRTGYNHGQGPWNEDAASAAYRQNTQGSMFGSAARNATGMVNNLKQHAGQMFQRPFTPTYATFDGKGGQGSVEGKPFKYNPTIPSDRTLGASATNPSQVGPSGHPVSPQYATRDGFGGSRELINYWSNTPGDRIPHQIEGPRQLKPVQQQPGLLSRIGQGIKNFF